MKFELIVSGIFKQKPIMGIWLSLPYRDTVNAAKEFSEGELDLNEENCVAKRMKMFQRKWCF